MLPFSPFSKPSHILFLQNPHLLFLQPLTPSEVHSLFFFDYINIYMYIYTSYVILTEQKPLCISMDTLKNNS